MFLINVLKQISTQCFTFSISKFAETLIDNINHVVIFSVKTKTLQMYQNLFCMILGLKYFTEVTF